MRSNWRCGNQNRTQIGVLFILSSNLHVTENMISKNVAVKYKTDLSKQLGGAYYNMMPTFFNINYNDSASETFVLCLWDKFVVENSPSPSDEATLDRPVLEIELDTESGFDTSFLNIWESEWCCSVLSGAGFPWASSARRLRRFIIVGTTFDEMDSIPGSCEQNMHK